MNSENQVILEDVFKINGIPTYTYVEPKKYPELLSNLRTQGRGLVIEGPSGIGKTTAIETALKSLGINFARLTARIPNDVEMIKMIPAMSKPGVVLVDDFHRLPDDIRRNIADYMKILADTEPENTKVIVLGINRAGDNLVQLAPDLVNRIDVIKFESEPDSKIHELIKKGEEALNTNINVKAEIIKEAQGSFYLAQMLCKEICIYSDIRERNEQLVPTSVSFEGVCASVWDKLGRLFKNRCDLFCTGSKLRKEGRAPYLHILNWLATCKTWTLDLREQIRQHSELRGSVTQVVDKGYLKKLIESNPDLRQVLHFEEQSELLSIEDPQFLFYIKNIPWHQFARDLGYVTFKFERRYDFALSFAGSDREVAEELFTKLSDNEVEVFYDRNEQHRILSEDIEEYLLPIYKSEARFVIVLLGRDYPKRIWAKIESDAFKERFKDGDVIPIWFSDAPPGMFDTSRIVGGIDFDRGKDITIQVDEISRVLLKKLMDSRIAEQESEAPRFPNM
jgi:hypothetical protein